MKTIELKKDGKAFKIGAILCFVYAVLALFVFIAGFASRVEHATKNIVRINGIIERIEYNQDENRYEIYLLDDETLYQVPDSRVEESFLDSIKIGDNVTLEHSSSSKIKMVHYLSIGSNILCSYYEDFINGLIVMEYIGLGVAIILLGFGVFFIVKYRKRPIITVNYIDEIIKENILQISNNLARKDNKTPKDIAKVVLSYLGFILVDIIFIAIFASKYPDKPQIIVPIFIGCFVVATVYLIAQCKLNPYKEKDIDAFLERYLNPLFEDIEKVEGDPNIIFEDQGITFINYEFGENQDNFPVEVKTFISYDDLNLSCSVAYLNRFHSCVIYIHSNLDENNENFKQYFDIIWILEPEILKQIKDYNVEVRGLNYLLNNLKTEIILHHHRKIKKVKIVRY